MSLRGLNPCEEVVHYVHLPPQQQERRQRYHCDDDDVGDDDDGCKVPRVVYGALSITVNRPKLNLLYRNMETACLSLQSCCVICAGVAGLFVQLEAFCNYRLPDPCVPVTRGAVKRGRRTVKNTEALLVEPLGSLHTGKLVNK